MFARFDENPAMTLRVIKETKRYGRTDGRTDNVKTVYPLQTKFAGGINTHIKARSIASVNIGTLSLTSYHVQCLKSQYLYITQLTSLLGKTLFCGQ